MTTDLVAWIAKRIDAEGLDEQVGLLILAALEGTDSLEEYLEAGEARTSVAEAAADDEAAAEPVGAFLREIQVELWDRQSTCSEAAETRGAIRKISDGLYKAG